MNPSSEKFLYDLLHTPSPSGKEEAIQRKWLEYIKPCADKLQTDTAGNAMASLQPDAPFQVLLAGHCDEIGFLVKSIDEKGYVYVEKLGGISHKPALGMKVDILGTHKRITGVIGAKAEHHGGAKDSFGFSDLFIDCGASSKKELEDYIAVGDAAVYKRDPEQLLNNRVSGRGLDNRTGAFIVAETLRRLRQHTLHVGVTAVSTVNEETNMGGAYFAGAGLSPSLGIAVDVTFATDYPGANTDKTADVILDGGPVLAKGAPINRKANQLLENAAKDKEIPLQYELTPKHTGTDADQLRKTGKGIPVSVVSLPLRYMHAPVETVSLKDIEQTIDLLTAFLTNLNGSEDLRPVRFD
ncbi:M20/M25/M40 family metallo-hydrolase [Alteribacillus bidgolensis]|uniref:Endoglucanase n=1 Tax=Alteribacillus bidgolensis TaxID=930129 RepID=A0A1G8LYZ1_9BACI|nr:M20/M25/M40 family metallo-hydrolase [Alteribacillus bidgolensis]SDI60876.1 endoglucanase [Alteribacillus bidgolensis]